MVELKIVINSLEDARAGNKIVEHSTTENTKECKDFTVGILEKGTVSGKTSIMFCLTDEVGNVHVAQITGNLLEALTSAYRGAVERFGA